ncbi:uncharacterized protein K452DRAFT_287436 [Aplosporella prunicola CBS 121167]|uniref:Uncharacterized protein n=1 Tax=Aplosporella prunicola CBS 121167 TaxID=1176127 RepID=A0A6A6BDS3_9PEZI|nr:uncharacterized protein K452DRAFT_287436 [Aplosporella prunicola CBS 121167]KAF2142216.1 hypothetical protein K452DRAFT_287436 [Aplosporella prunicola CBS 121167]
MNLNPLLLNRQLGTLSPRAFCRAETTRRLHALQPTTLQFDGAPPQDARSAAVPHRDVLAHPAGVNALTIDKFEGRWMLSGGADSSVALWDLEAVAQPAGDGDTSTQTLVPLDSLRKTSTAHSFGITHLSFYPFDSLAFLSSSYDHTLKVYASETLAASASFDLHAVIYSHALSPIAQHLLVACATQTPRVRLVDLRSGAATHSLAGHSGAVLSVVWSPIDDHVLASGGTDGTVRFWDVRRSAGCLGVLDAEDSVGVFGADGLGTSAARSSRQVGRAHAAAVNGVVWTDDGRHLVTTGHDERVRVWDAMTGANTLASFGPTIKNAHLSTLLPLISPPGLVAPGKDVLFYPSEHEILVYELFDGRLLKRLKTPGAAPAVPTGGPGPARRGGGNRGSGSGNSGNGGGGGGGGSSSGAQAAAAAATSAAPRSAKARARTTALAWRAHDVHLFSAHGDGRIRAWAPRTPEDALADDEELAERDAAEGSRKRKRDELDAIYRDFSRRQGGIL